MLCLDMFTSLSRGRFPFITAQIKMCCLEKGNDLNPDRHCSHVAFANRTFGTADETVQDA